MPHSSDEPPSDRISAGPPAARPPESPENAGTRPSLPSNSAEDLTTSNDPQSGMVDNGEAPRFPRRRRRRRRRPPRTADPAMVTAEGQSQAIEPTIAGDALQTADLGVTPPRYGEPHRRRRRRRGLQRVAGPTEAPVSEAPALQNASLPDSEPPDGTLREHRSPPRRGRRPPRPASSIDEAGTGLPGGARAPAVGSEPPEGQPRAPTHSRRRRRWPPRATDATTADADQAAGSAPVEITPAVVPRGRSAPYRGPRARGPDNHRTGSGDGRTTRGAEGRNRASRDRRARSKGAPSPADRRQGTGRVASKKGPEQRLYALESVVDRGFEDIPEAAEEGATRRVPWTIIKRTVADQQSGKPISTVYVLQRDGIDTEFPSLGTARAAANKTIIHPEKLTLSKAEHAAAKK